MYARHIANIFEVDGYRVVTTGSKHNGLRTLSNERFDIVVMAVDLQGTDDLEMLRSIDVVARSHSMDATLIATSVMIMPGDAEMCTAAGASRLVSKHTSSALVRAIIP
jgi:CheY-like chemotaxis protein